MTLCVRRYLLGVTVVTSLVLAILGTLLVSSMKKTSEGIRLRPTSIKFDASEEQPRALLSVDSKLSGLDDGPHGITVEDGHCRLHAGKDARTPIVSVHLVDINHGDFDDFSFKAQFEHGSGADIIKVLDEGSADLFYCELELAVDLWRSGFVLPYTHRHSGFTQDERRKLSFDIDVIPQKDTSFSMGRAYDTSSGHHVMMHSSHWVQATLKSGDHEDQAAIKTFIHDTEFHMKMGVSFTDADLRSMTVGAHVDSPLHYQEDNSGNLKLGFPVNLHGRAGSGALEAFLALAGASQQGKVKVTKGQEQHEVPAESHPRLHWRASRPNCALAALLGDHHVIGFRTPEKEKHRGHLWHQLRDASKQLREVFDADKGRRLATLKGLRIAIETEITVNDDSLERISLVGTGGTPMTITSTVTSREYSSPECAHNQIASCGFQNMWKHGVQGWFGRWTRTLNYLVQTDRIEYDNDAETLKIIHNTNSKQWEDSKDFQDKSLGEQTKWWTNNNYVFDSITEIDFRGHSIKETLTINGDWSETEHKHMAGWQALPQSSISEAWFISHQEMLALGDPASTLPPGGRRLSSVVKSIRSPSRILSAPTTSTSTGQDYFKIETGLELDGDGTNANLFRAYGTVTWGIGEDAGQQLSAHWKQYMANNQERIEIYGAMKAIEEVSLDKFDTSLSAVDSWKMRGEISGTFDFYASADYDRIIFSGTASTDPYMCYPVGRAGSSTATSTSLASKTAPGTVNPTCTIDWEQTSCCDTGMHEAVFDLLPVETWGTAWSDTINIDLGGDNARRLQSSMNLGDIIPFYADVATTRSGSTTNTDIKLMEKKDNEADSELAKLMIVETPNSGGNSWVMTAHVDGKEEARATVRTSVSGDDRTLAIGLSVEAQLQNEHLVTAQVDLDRNGQGPIGATGSASAEVGEPKERLFRLEYDLMDGSNDDTDMLNLDVTLYDENNAQMLKWAQEFLFAHSGEQLVKKLKVHDGSEVVIDFNLDHKITGDRWDFNAKLRDGQQTIVGAIATKRRTDTEKKVDDAWDFRFLGEADVQEARLQSNMGTDNWRQKYYFDANLRGKTEPVGGFRSYCEAVEASDTDTSYSANFTLVDKNDNSDFVLLAGFYKTPTVGLVTGVMKDSAGEELVTLTGSMPVTESGTDRYYDGSVTAYTQDRAHSQALNVKVSDGFLPDPSNPKGAGFTKFDARVSATIEDIKEDISFYVTEAPWQYATDVCGFGGDVKIFEIVNGVDKARSQTGVDVDLPIDFSSMTTLPPTLPTTTEPVVIEVTRPPGTEEKVAEVSGQEKVTAFETTVQITDIDTFDADAYIEEVAKTAAVSTDKVKAVVKYQVEVKYEFDSIVTPDVAKTAIAAAMDVAKDMIEVTVKLKTGGRRLSDAVEVDAKIKADTPAVAKTLKTAAADTSTLNSMKAELEVQGVVVSTPVVAEVPKNTVSVETQVTAAADVPVAAPTAEQLDEISTASGGTAAEANDVVEGAIRYIYVYVEPTTQPPLQFVTPRPLTVSPGSTSASKVSADTPAVGLFIVSSLVLGWQ